MAVTLRLPRGGDKPISSALCAGSNALRFQADLTPELDPAQRLPPADAAGR